MLRWLTLLLLLVHVASPARGKVPQGAPANPLPIRELEVEGVQSYRLGNGLRVLLLPEPSAASLTVEVAYSVGSRHEGYGEAGMAHLLEHLMFKGTARFPKPDEEIIRRGGEWNAETEVDHTRYYQTHLPSEDNLRVALALEADRMTQVRFRQDDLSREFQVVRNELELADSDPRDILLRRIHHAAFSVHSYGRDPIGTRSDIERVSLVRLQAFYARHYRPDNAHLIISGRKRCCSWSGSCLARSGQSVLRQSEPTPKSPRKTASVMSRCVGTASSRSWGCTITLRRRRTLIRRRWQRWQTS